MAAATGNGFDAPGDERRAAFFEWMTDSERRKLTDALEATGMTLRPLDDSDSAASVFRLRGPQRLPTIAGLPHVLIMRLRGRKSGTYVINAIGRANAR